MSAPILLNTSGDDEEEDEPVPLPPPESAYSSTAMEVDIGSISSEAKEIPPIRDDTDEDDVDVEDVGQRARGDDGVLEGVAIGGTDAPDSSSDEDEELEQGIVIHCARKSDRQRRASSSRFSFG